MLVLAVIVVNDASPVMARSPVNVTPVLVIVQSCGRSKVPDVSGDAAVQSQSSADERLGRTHRVHRTTNHVEKHTRQQWDVASPGILWTASRPKVPEAV